MDQMDNKTLGELKELDEQLRKLQSVDELDPGLIRQLRKDIDALLQRSEKAAAGSHESLIKQLEDATGRFEVSHPELTMIMARVINSLSNMGI